MFRLLALALLAGPVAAHIVTDRPDLTESAQAVSGLQIETGLLVDYTERGADEIVTVAGPQALVRLGVAPGVEARLGLPDDQVLDVGGAKAELGAVGAWDLAAIAEASLPRGDDRFSGAASPLAILVAGRDLGDLSLGTQAEVRWTATSTASTSAARSSWAWP